MERILETELYIPIKQYFEKMGYEVKAEIKKCDIVAEKDGHIIIIEQKNKINMKLLAQALDRQKLTEHVYIAVPRPPKGLHTDTWKETLPIIKRLEIGLLTVALDSPIPTVEEILPPGAPTMLRKNKKRALQLQNEFHSRSGDFNIGGSVGKKILTAYREKNIQLACLIEHRGTVTAKQLKSDTGFDYAKYLQNNTYQWFHKVERGTYALSPQGKVELLNPTVEFAPLVQYYKNEATME